MSRSSLINRLRGLAKVSLWAGIFVLGLTVSGAQAATVTVYQDGNNGVLNGGGAAFNIAAGALGSIVTEDFTDGVLVPELTITFGSSLPGSISGGLYHDRATDTVGFTTPLITFNGLGAMAFGGSWDLGPNSPGTGIKLHITFVDNSVLDLTTEILNPSSSTGFAGFFGIVSDMAIRSIRLDEATAQQFLTFETFDFDNAQLVSAVPIPAALPLFLSAIAALGFFGRRRNRVLAA